MQFNIFMSVNKTTDLIPIAGNDPESLAMIFRDHDIDPRYAQRLLYWIYKRNITSFTEINDIPKKIVSAIEGTFVTGLFEPLTSVLSDDGSIKYLFRNANGLAYEAVYMPEGKRSTVCVSVQSGCRMGCRFCATGKYGWKGNLTAGEIINQVVSIPHKITHVVLMGMGEAGDNIDEVIKACRILTAQWGLAVGRAKVTVSTVGILPSLRRLLEETDCNITLSLHSPFAEERKKVIPAETRWPFASALAMMKEFQLKKLRRFTVAYVMLSGINDTGRHLDELIRLLKGNRVRINLLPYHPFEGDENRSTSYKNMMEFKHALVSSGIEATVRRSRGKDIDAACGMLAAVSVTE